MGISTTTGLISGIDYGSIVAQLMELNAIPRDNLSARVDELTQEQYAVTELATYVLSVQYITENLSEADLFEEKSVESSNSSALYATITGDPAEGTHYYTPVQTAQQQQLLTSGVESSTGGLGGGAVSIRFGADVEEALDLDAINGGDGFDPGSIRITDRSGNSAQIDLSMAQTIDDVLDAINENTQIGVTAKAHGDGIRLIDDTGSEISNLIVQEVNGGATAESLGLSGIDVAESAVDGEDLVSLSDEMDLDFLNDGNGVSRNPALADIVYELSDGTKGTIDFSLAATTDSEATEETSLGEVLDIINAEAPDKLRVEISEDGKRLVVHDLTEGDGTFSVESASGSTAAEDLGIAGESTDGEITGERIIGGLKSVLVSTLGGSEKLGDLGAMELTDRTGATDTISLAGVETLEDVIDAINAADVGIAASVNRAKNGILLTDTTGGSASNMIVASADSKETAEKLGIAIDDAMVSFNSGDLHQQVVSRNTLLADLNGGSGVSLGTITIADSDGLSSDLEIDPDVETVGDLIRAINRLGANVYAEINETGDGIWIRDQADGTGTLSVAEDGSSTAADLHLLGSAKTVEIDGEEYEVVDGSTTLAIELEEDESLEDLIGRINELDGNVSVSLLNDGSRNPYRMTLTSGSSGEAGAMVVDLSQLGFTVTETAEARDALLVLGESTSAGSGVVLRSNTNTFTGAIDGVTLTAQNAANSPVAVTVSTSSENLIANMETFVKNYNSLRESLSGYTAYDADTEKASVLTGDGTALRLETALNEFVSDRFHHAGSIQSLAEIGIEIEDDGTLTFDSTVLKKLFKSDREAVMEFFTAEDHGFAAKFNAVADKLADEETGLLTIRYTTIGETIAEKNEKIKFMGERLDILESRLYADFTAMELSIAKMQSNLDFLDSIQYIKMPNSSSNN